MDRDGSIVARVQPSSSFAGLALAALLALAFSLLPLALLVPFTSMCALALSVGGYKRYHSFAIVASILAAVLVVSSYPIESDIGRYQDLYSGNLSIRYSSEVVYFSLAAVSRLVGFDYEQFMFVIGVASYVVISYVVFSYFGRGIYGTLCLCALLLFPILIYRQVFISRQFLGSVSFLVAMLWLTKGRFKRSVVMFMLAVLSHFSFVIFGWVYIKWARNILSKRVVMASCFAIAVLMPMNMEYFVDVVSSVLGVDLPYVVVRKLTYYAEGGATDSVSFFKPLFIFSALPFIAFLFARWRTNASDVWFSLTSFSIVLMVFFRNISILSGRLGFFLSIFSPLVAFIAICHMERRMRHVLAVSYFGLLIIYYTGWIYMNDMAATSLVMAEGQLSTRTGLTIVERIASWVISGS